MPCFSMENWQFNHPVSSTGTSSGYHHLPSGASRRSSCEFDGHIVMISSSCDLESQLKLLVCYSYTSSCCHLLVVSTCISACYHNETSTKASLCSPNEDVGRSDEPFRTLFRSTFQRFVAQIEYSHPWKVLRKRIRKGSSDLPKSSFGRGKVL